jgi:lycopene beta-cyclase
VDNYDYIISGAGAAGLSLLASMMQYSSFKEKTILVVDKAPKNQNDHTWCYWEKEPGLFEPIVHHQWQQVHFFSKQFSSLINLAPYTYKMIRSIDFYNYVLDKASKHVNIHFKYGDVVAAGNEGRQAFVLVDNQKYTAGYVFNSILFSKPSVPAGKHYLLQHFKGIVIKTETPVFNPAAATLMDFRVSQEHGTTFVYVLPVSETKALVEYTLFTKNVLQQDEYSTALQNYVNSYLGLTDYTIEEEEFGIIPMTNINFVKSIGRVINIGTAGGQTKGSSGYTFRFIQKHSAQLVSDLLRYGSPRNETPLMYNRFRMYDSIMLNVLANDRLPGEQIFADLFKKNPADRVLRFLDNESSLEDEINLIGTLPTAPFFKAGLEEVLK